MKQAEHDKLVSLLALYGRYYHRLHSAIDANGPTEQIRSLRNDLYDCLDAVGKSVFPLGCSGDDDRQLTGDPDQFLLSREM